MGVSLVCRAVLAMDAVTGYTVVFDAALRQCTAYMQYSVRAIHFIETWINILPEIVENM